MNGTGTDEAFLSWADKLLADAIELDPALAAAPQWPDGPSWRELV